MKKVIVMILLSLSLFAAKLEVIGQGLIKAEPNIVKINLGVQTQKSTVGEAMDVNKKLISDLYNKLVTLGIEKKDITTSQFYLNYYLDQDKKDVYTVSNNLEVRVKNLDKLNEILSTSTEVGVNNIWGINFVNDNTEDLAKKARIAAVEDAKKKATEYAKASGMTLGKVIELSEVQSYNYGFETKAKTASFGGDMVYSPSELTYTESVKVIYEIK